jgi:hypothetical protein
MGYKCNQSSSTLKNEVTKQSVFHSINSTQFSCGDSSSGAKKLKQHRQEVANKCHFLEWWYFKTTTFNDEDFSSSDKQTTDEQDRQQQKVVEEEEEKASTSLAYRNYQQRISLPHSIRTTNAARKRGGGNGTLATSSSNISHSHLVRQSICFYAASSVILALCYLTTPTSASTDAASHPV